MRKGVIREGLRSPNKAFEEGTLREPLRGSMNKGFCNPSTKYIFRFSFYLGSFFFSLSLFKNKREMILCWKQGFSTTLSTKLFATLSTKSLYSFWIKGLPLTQHKCPVKARKIHIVSISRNEWGIELSHLWILYTVLTIILYTVLTIIVYTVLNHYCLHRS